MDGFGFREWALGFGEYLGLWLEGRFGFCWTRSVWDS